MTILALASPFKSHTHHHVVKNVISIETNDHYFFLFIAPTKTKYRLMHEPHVW